MRLATPRSTPRDDPNHHYLWVIVGMLYVSQGSAGELRDGAGGGKQRGGSVGATVSGGWRRPQDGWRCCGCRELISQEPTPMETQASEEPHPSCTLPCLPVARALDLSLSVLLSLFHLTSVSRSFSVLPHLLRNLRTLPSSPLDSSLP